MDTENRRILDQYCDILAPKIKLRQLLPKLIKNGVFNKDDVKMIQWQKKLNDIETTKEVFLTIKTRGPDAFRNLLLSLRQSDHEELAFILSQNLESTKKTNLSGKSNKNFSHNKSEEKNTSDNNEQKHIFSEEQNKNVNENIKDGYYKIMQTTNQRLNIVVQKSIAFRDGPIIGQIERYPMRSNPRGIVLIINNVDFKHLKDRSSSIVDEENLDKLFNFMGFRVTVHRNLNGKDMKKTFRDFTRKNNFSTVHSCFVIVCSHGNQVPNNDYYCTEIQCTDWNEPDYEMVTDKDILDNFTTNNCLELAGKPKIFIFQTCRGLKEQNSVFRSTTDGYDTKVIAATEKIPTLVASRNQLTELDLERTMRNYSDTLIAYSTVPGYVSFRDTITGSWLINILCEVFMNYASEMHVQDMLHLVDSRLQELRTAEGQCQTLVVHSVGFNKHCYLNPGLFE